MLAAVLFYTTSFISVLKSKSKIFPVICLVLYWILINLSHDHADFGVYTRTFDAIAQGRGSSYEILFVWLMRIISFLHVDYEGFRMIVSTVVVLVMYRVFKDYSTAPSTVWGLYLIFSAIYDAPLMRHLIGLPIILFGLRYLDVTETDPQKIRSNDTKFMIVVFSAALFHSAFWYFLIVWACFKIKDTKSLCIFVALFVGFGLVLTSTNLVFYVFRLLPIRVSVIDKYMTGLYRNFNGRIYDLIKQACIAGFGYISYMTNKKRYMASISFDKYRFNEIAYKLNIVMFTLVPLLAYTPVLQRLNRVLIIANYCMMGNALCQYKIRDARRLGLILLGILFAVVLLYLLLFYESKTLESIFYMHFKENDFFMWLNLN